LDMMSQLLFKKKFFIFSSPLSLIVKQGLGKTQPLERNQ
jgi:hypothetical protein